MAAPCLLLGVRHTGLPRRPCLASMRARRMRRIPRCVLFPSITLHLPLHAFAAARGGTVPLLPHPLCVFHRAHRLLPGHHLGGTRPAHVHDPRYPGKRGGRPPVRQPAPCEAPALLTWVLGAQRNAAPCHVQAAHQCEGSRPLKPHPTPPHTHTTTNPNPIVPAPPQTMMVKELFKLARHAQAERKLPGFRAQQWYFFFVAAFWMYIRWAIQGRAGLVRRTPECPAANTRRGALSYGRGKARARPASTRATRPPPAAAVAGRPTGPVPAAWCQPACLPGWLAPGSSRTT